jgi:hypothetical protein
MFKRNTTKVNLNRLLANNGYLKSKKVNNIEELDALYNEDYKYVERRMNAELSKLVNSIDEEEDKPREPKQKKRFNNLHYIISKSKVFNSDRILCKGHNNSIVYAENRLAIKKDELEKCVTDLSKFIVTIAITSRWGVFLDGLGHLFVNNKTQKLELHFFYFTNYRMGNMFNNIKVLNSERIKELIDMAKKKGQEWEDSEIITKAFEKYYKHQMIDTVEANIDIDIEAIKKRRIFESLLK